MTTVERVTWINFKKVVKNFLGNNENNNYKELVEGMPKNF